MGLRRVFPRIGRYPALGGAAIIWLLAGASSALAAERPDHLLRRMLAEEFHGGSSLRAAEAGRGEDGAEPCGCADHPQAVFIDSEPVVVVSDWRLGKQPAAKAKAKDEIRLTASFKVVAETVLGTDGHRQFRKVTPPAWQRTDYRLKMVNGRWRVIDPPPVHVALEPLRQAIQAEQARLQEMAENGPPNPDYQRGVAASLAWRQGQLDALK